MTGSVVQRLAQQQLGELFDGISFVDPGISSHLEQWKQQLGELFDGISFVDPGISSHSEQRKQQLGQLFDGISFVDPGISSHLEQWSYEVVLRLDTVLQLNAATCRLVQLDLLVHCLIHLSPE